MIQERNMDYLASTLGNGINVQIVSSSGASSNLNDSVSDLNGPGPGANFHENLTLRAGKMKKMYTSLLTIGVGNNNYNRVNDDVLKSNKLTPAVSFKIYFKSIKFSAQTCGVGFAQENLQSQLLSTAP